jgi:ABC-type xylose transport system permease subunit
MTYTYRGKAGISSAVVALFTVVIVFAALAPTLLFTRSLYAILSNEVNERRYSEVDR